MIRRNGDSTGQVRALWIGGVVALSLHALVFSFLQLRDLRRSRPERLRSRDNTPELLQFSNQAAQAKPPKEVVAPRIPMLPPPTLRDSPAASVPSRESGRSSAGSARGFSSRGAPGTAVAATSREGQDPSGGNPKRMRTDGDRRKDRTTTRLQRPLLKASTNEWAAALERLQTLDPQEVSSREAQKGGAGAAATGWAAGEGKAVVRLDPNSSLGQAYQALWSEASPQRRLPTLSGSGGPSASVEVRRASWRNVRAAELPIRHGQILILADKIFLLWLQDDHLYLLQASPIAESRG